MEKLTNRWLPPGLLDTLEIDAAVAGASQSALIPQAVAARPGWLRSFAEGYFPFLRRLLLVGAVRELDGSWRVGLAIAPRRLTLLRFTPPYLAAARGGRELRYPIVGGLMARRGERVGHLAFGAVQEGHDSARAWVDVVGYTPRLGLGRAYRYSQAQLHRLITIAYLWRVARASH